MKKRNIELVNYSKIIKKDFFDIKLTNHCFVVILVLSKGKILKSTEKQELKKKISRIGLFLLIVFLPMLVVCILLQWAGVKEQWITILVLVVLMFVLFFVYIFICSKLDAKKKERISKKKDPFSD